MTERGAVRSLRMLGAYHVILAAAVGAFCFWSGLSRASSHSHPLSYVVPRWGMVFAALAVLILTARKDSTWMRWILGIVVTTRALAVVLIGVAEIGIEKNGEASWLLVALVVEAIVVWVWCTPLLLASKRARREEEIDVELASLSAIITGIVAIVSTAFSVFVLGDYGTSLFALTPLALGALAAFLRGADSPATFADCLSSALTATWLAMIGLLVLALEGIICIAMAFPLTIGMVMVGAALGYGLQRARWHRGAVTTCLVLISPLSMIGENAMERMPLPVEVVTEQHVPVSSEQLWSVMTTPTQLGLSSTMLGKIGLTVPEHIELKADGSQRMLECQTSNGDIRLDVLEYAEGKKLAFRPSSNVAPMKELTPYEEIEAPHLNGYFEVELGAIEIEPQGDGTLVRATTRLRHRIWPATYWELFTYPIFDTMHSEVIAALADAAQRGQRR